MPIDPYCDTSKLATANVPHCVKRGYCLKGTGGRQKNSALRNCHCGLANIDVTAN
jgi:hypothetical protein